MMSSREWKETRKSRKQTQTRREESHSETIQIEWQYWSQRKNPKQIEKEETFSRQENKKKEKNEHSGSNNENHETSFGIGVYG